MKKIILIFLCSLLTFPVMAEVNVINYIYGKAMVGDVEGLKLLVKNGYSLETKDDDGNTAYCLAVFRRNQTAIRTLEAVGVNIRPRCLKSVPIVTEAMLYKAAHNRNVKQITVWQEYGVPVDLVDNRTGNTALCQAVYEKDCEAIDILLKAGASEYHNCMRRVPQKVRQELDCKPVVIDWERVGLTALGAGLVAGGVAIALSGGGGGDGQSCAINEHWDGEKCAVCPGTSCWNGKKCQQPDVGWYTNPKTNRCMQIAPPPYKDGTYDVKKIKNGGEYKKGGFLQAINAADAYAHGYTGYYVSRNDIFGGLTYGQTSEPGKAEKTGSITSSRPVVAVLSTGTEIKNTTQTDPETGEKTIVRYVNKDLTQEIMEKKEVSDGAGGTTTEFVGTGKWKGNLATNSSGALVGYNFDYGYKGYIDNGSGGTSKIYNGSQYWDWDSESKTFVIPSTHKEDRFSQDTSIKGSYYSGSIYYFTGTGDANQVYLVLRGSDSGCEYETGCGIATAGEDSVLPYELVDLKTCGTQRTCLSPPENIQQYMYLSDYNWAENDPAPHYYLNGNQSRTWNKGTFLAGVVAALKNEGEKDVPSSTEGNMHGVAYNTVVLPAIADIFRPVTSKAIEHLISPNYGNADVILQDVVFASTASYPTALDVKGKTMEGFFGADAAAAYRNIAETGTIFVVGTGSNGKNIINSGIVQYDEVDDDDGITQPYQKEAGVSAGVPLASDASYTDSSGNNYDLSKLFLSVTAVQPNGAAQDYNGYTLTPYAQPCGSTAKYCISAPGGTQDAALYSTVSTTDMQNEYNWSQDYGSSAAAAVVAGAVALLKGAYPHLSSQEVVALLKQTATPLGACAGADGGDIDKCTAVENSKGDIIGHYSTLYGWGLINLEAATKPVGALWVRYGDTAAVEPYIGRDYILSRSTVTGVPVMTQSLQNALPSSFTAFDSFDRPFAVATRPLLNVHSKRKEFDEDFKAFMHGRDVTKVEANDQFSMTYAPRTSYRSSEVKAGLMEMNVDFNKTNFGFYYTEDTLNSRGNYIERALNNPFVQIQEAYGVEMRHNLTSKLSVGMSFTTGKNGFLGDGDKNYKAPENKVSMVSTEANYQATKSIMFKASYGVMKEQDSVLGMIGTGAFKTTGADTNYASVGIEIKPTDKFKLNLAYTYGWTTPNQTDGLMNLSRLTADGFAAVAQYDLGSDNMLGLSISSPLRVRSGKVAFDLPVGRSATDDTIYRETFTGSMKPTARELDFALFYRDALTDALTIQSELGMRLHPDHQKDADTDYRAMFGLKWDY